MSVLPACHRPETHRRRTQDATQYLPFVRKVVLRLARRLPSHIRIDDLMGAGVVGLIEALDRFDPTRASDFETFAEFRVKGAVLDELRRRDIMARDARLAAKRIENTIDAYTRQHGREPEEEEMAQELGLSLEEYRAKLQKLTPVRVFSLDDVSQDGPTDTAEGPFDHVARRELVARLAEAIEKLGERHQRVLQLYYYEELTLREIGEVLGVTESRICQMVSEATLRLRALLGVTDSRPKRTRRRAGGF